MGRMDVDEKAREVLVDALADARMETSDLSLPDAGDKLLADLMRDRVAEALREARKHGAEKMQDVAAEAAEGWRDGFYSAPARVRALDVSYVLDHDDDPEDETDAT